MSLSFFFNDPSTAEIYTLSLHDALPISLRSGRAGTGDLGLAVAAEEEHLPLGVPRKLEDRARDLFFGEVADVLDRKSTCLNSSHSQISYAVFCLKKKKKQPNQ